MLDGRFNTYNPHFKEYFSLVSEVAVVVGPDYRKQVRYTLPSHSQQGGIRYNLRRVREWLILSKFYDESEQVHFFNKSIDKAGRVANQILSMVHGKEVFKKFTTSENVKQTFPEVNVKILEETKWLYENLDELDALYHNTKLAAIIKQVPASEISKVMKAKSQYEKKYAEYYLKRENPELVQSELAKY